MKLNQKGSETNEAIAEKLSVFRNCICCGGKKEDNMLVPIRTIFYGKHMEDLSQLKVSIEVVVEWKEERVVTTGQDKMVGTHDF